MALAGAVLLLVLFQLAGWYSGLLTGRMADEAVADPAKVARLPAAPQDIERHGEAAKTVLAPDDARARNEAVAFDPRKGEAAAPFAFRGSEVDRMRARECLATAVLYEAGDDTVGEAAVAQVVLNRVRHAAFPRTVCGVVYQGAERTTGCQFTFTCDGSLRRRMSEAAWQRARDVAEKALSGHVEESVGLATHYHTNWVYPYWSPSLRKLGQVGTHLFFGWPGSWGGAKAFRRPYLGSEAPVSIAAPGVSTTDDAAAITAIDPGAPKILGLPQAPAKLPAGMGNVPLYGNRLKLVGYDGHSFGLLAPAGQSAAKLVNAALALCADPGPCRVNAWGNEDDVPGEFPISAGSRAMMVFEYERSGGGTTIRFDCTRFPNRDTSKCLKAATEVPEVLAGIRFKKDRPSSSGSDMDASVPE
ncbi:cell wall hydrolase [Novosphingobium aquimarinum]|uniref:cell wall hydrolase n=1 Tax=Novosphingobium aquimarinum TaxID=2682494 RepID=UPI001E4D166B|nr:cell wall hydrolase [Novosphingobium aquimarinum]